ncbi:MAG: HIT family protein [Betaproteobacteria bacterium]|nr:HIT family protein [Betaproteobacteria bacterium]
MCAAAGETLLWSGRHARVVWVDDAAHPGYCRVIWAAHVKEMTDLSATERTHLMGLVFAVESAVRTAFQPDKINLASLGNLVPHLHWHVIPRYAEDPEFPNAIWGPQERPARPIARGSREVLATGLVQALAELSAEV